MQKIAPLKPFQPQSKSLQILHVNGCHWIAVSTVDCTASTEDIVVYDSKYASLSTETKLLLSQLVHTDKPAFTVKVASVTKQSGSADCGVFAIAYITSIAFGLDPAQYVFNQAAMRPHLQKCFEEKKSHLSQFCERDDHLLLPAQFVLKYTAIVDALTLEKRW